jgi:hypothetical protein
MADYTPAWEEQAMSDAEITEPTTEAPTEDVVEEQPQGSTPDTDWKAEARKWESRAKADHDAANKWREFELSQKSDMEKLSEELERYKTEASQASLQVARLQVASEKGIPHEALELLTGNSREELEAAADKLLTLVANQSKTNTPKPDVNQGKPATGGTSAADQFASALGNLL